MSFTPSARLRTLKEKTIVSLRALWFRLTPAVVEAVVGAFLLGLAVGTNNKLAGIASVCLLVSAASSRVLRTHNTKLFRRMARIARLTQHRVRQLNNRLDKQMGDDTARESVELANTLPAPAPSDLAALASASLEDSSFPRLARSRQNKPAIRVLESPPPQTERAAPELAPKARKSEMLEAWIKAKKDRNLADCKSAIDALRPLLKHSESLAMESQLDAIACDKEIALRDAFIKCIHQLDYASALQVGIDICRQLPDSAVARDFERIKPLLEEKIDAKADKPADAKSQASGEKATA